MAITVREIFNVLGIDCSTEIPIEGFEVDSRKINPGFVFFALKGDSVDGHAFLSQALANGAICAIVSTEYVGEIKGLLLIRVKNVLESLHKLATWKLAKLAKPVIAVTGSVGKTTTKEFIATLLEGKFSVQKTPGNANSQVGLPLSILNAQEEGEMVVLEMGMNHPGEISSLLQMAPPDIAIVTKVALAHSLYFPKGIEEIALAKAEILEHPKTQKAILNAQVKQFKAFQKKRNLDCIFYGLQSDFFANDADVLLCQEGENFFIQEKGLLRTQTFPLPFKASHLLENFLAASIVAREMGINWDLIFSQAKLLTPYKMRFEKIEKNGIVYINDAYNANAESMKAALKNLPFPEAYGKTIAVLGEMRELGLFSESAHREVGREAAERVDLLLCLEGDCIYMAEEFALSGKPVYTFSDLERLKKVLFSEVKRGDVVLVKASKSLKMWTVLEGVD